MEMGSAGKALAVPGDSLDKDRCETYRKLFSWEAMEQGKVDFDGRARIIALLRTVELQATANPSWPYGVVIDERQNERPLRRDDVALTSFYLIHALTLCGYSIIDSGTKDSNRRLVLVWDRETSLFQSELWKGTVDWADGRKASPCPVSLSDVL